MTNHQQSRVDGTPPCRIDIELPEIGDRHSGVVDRAGLQRSHQRIWLVMVLCLGFLSIKTSWAQTAWDDYTDKAETAFEQARYTEAKQLTLAAIQEAEKLGDENAHLATSFNNLASIYQLQGQYTEAEKFFQRAQAIWQKILGREHPQVLNNLADLYRMQGHYSKAQRLNHRSLDIFKELFGPEHPYVATSLNNLAGVYYLQDKQTEAEEFFQRSLAVWEKTIGPDHPKVATTLNNLAVLYTEQGRYTEARRLFDRCLPSRRRP